MLKPEIVVIAGPNGSGKSTYSEFIIGPNQFADETFEYMVKIYAVLDRKVEERKKYSQMFEHIKPFSYRIDS